MEMTIEQVRDWHRECEAVGKKMSAFGVLVREHGEMADAIDAYIASTKRQVSDEDVERACRIVNTNVTAACRVSPIRMRAALESLPAQAVPEGWKLVPISPNEAMRHAAFDIEISTSMSRITFLNGKETTNIWQAMLNAAPEYKP